MSWRYLALQLETVESPMYAKLITRQSGSSSRKTTGLAPLGPVHRGAGRLTVHVPPARDQTHRQQHGHDRQIHTSSDRCQCAPAQASEAPPIPPRLYEAWNPSMMLRPYVRWRLTPSMSWTRRAPPPRARTRRATARPATSGRPRRPQQRQEHGGLGEPQHHAGPDPLDQLLGADAAGPREDRHGREEDGSSPSDIPYRSWIAGMRVTRRAKAMPCAKKLTARDALPCRRRASVMAAQPRAVTYSWVERSPEQSEQLPHVSK